MQRILLTFLFVLAALTTGAADGPKADSVWSGHKSGIRGQVFLIFPEGRDWLTCGFQKPLKTVARGLRLGHRAGSAVLMKEGLGRKAD
jgi:hypothetical protein